MSFVVSVPCLQSEVRIAAKLCFLQAIEHDKRRGRRETEMRSLNPYFAGGCQSANHKQVHRTHLCGIAGTASALRPRGSMLWPLKLPYCSHRALCPGRFWYHSILGLTGYDWFFDAKGQKCIPQYCSVARSRFRWNQVAV